MNVDWDWAKQRPHFLAEGLSRTNEVLVLYPYSWRRSKLVVNSRNGVKLARFFRIPFGGRLSCVRKLNSIFLKGLFFIMLARNKFDVIWISSPEMFESMPSRLIPSVIYDCMDDIVEFKANSKNILEKSIAEKVLIRESKHIFCSSLRLKNKMLERGAHKDQCTVVFNALDVSSYISDLTSIKIEKKIKSFNVGYFGTISDWFDFQAVIKAVNELPEIIFYLAGPVDNIDNLMPDHDRIIFLGPMDHKNLREFAAQFDLLVMPFLVTNLVLSVDPVKLYEYIFFDRPVLSVFYPGLEKFEKFIQFYEGHDQFISKIKQYFSSSAEKKKFLDDDREAFIRCNSWENRLEAITYVLDNLEVRNDS